jgi:hypothetical protein
LTNQTTLLAKKVGDDYFLDDEESENNEESKEKEKEIKKAIGKEIDNLNHLYINLGLKISRLNRYFNDYLSEIEKEQNDKKISTINKRYDKLVSFTESLHMIEAVPTQKGLRNVVKTIAELEKINKDVEEMAKELQFDLHRTF